MQAVHSFAIQTIFCGVLWVGLSGCGRKPGPEHFAIRGEVTLESDLLESGRITFIPIEDAKGPSAVATIKDGVYQFDRTNGPVAGKHRVEIESIANPGFELDDEAAYAKAVREGKGKLPLPSEVIAPEFNRNSTLQAIIRHDGKVHYDFDLKRSLVALRR